MKRYFLNNDNGHMVETQRGPWVRWVDAQALHAALEKLLRAEEKYVRDTGLPQPDDLIQDAVNEARTLLGWPALGVKEEVPRG